MNYYGYTFDRESALQHHGILGMKWGVRRFQNKDGSLTKAGKSRYGRGKDLYREKAEIQAKEEKRLQKSSKAYQKAEREAARLVEKYGLDADDGGGGYSIYSEEQLRRAGDRYWQQAEDMAALQDQFSEKARKYADEQIIAKYGDTAMSDIKHYETVTNTAAAAAFIAGLGAVLWATSK